MRAVDSLLLVDVIPHFTRLLCKYALKFINSFFFHIKESLAVSAFSADSTPVTDESKLVENLKYLKFVKVEDVLILLIIELGDGRVVGNAGGFTFKNVSVKMSKQNALV